MGLRLHPYNPDKDMKVAAFNALWKLTKEHNADALRDLPLTDDEVEEKARRRELRRRWYYERGGKEIARKNGQDRRARLKKLGLLGRKK